MSDAKGPYTLNEDDAGRYVISDMPSHLATFESHLDASVAVLIANLAHAHALTAQAERVKQLENLLGMCEDVLIDIEPSDKEWQRDPQELLAEIKAALTPPAKGGT